MFNKNAMNIAKFDFLNTMKSKGYIVLNIVLCVLIIVAANISGIIKLFKNTGIIRDNDYALEVYDVSGKVYQALSENLNKELFKDIVKLDKPATYTFDSINEKTIAVNILEDNEKLYDNISVITKDTVSDKVYSYIKEQVAQVREKTIQEKYNMEDVDILSYKSEVLLNQTILSTAKNQNGVTQIVTTFIGYVIFMLIMTITTTVASSIANEKTSKSAEYILSTIPPKDYLNGKVIAANFKTLLTMILIIFYALVALLINQVFFVNLTNGDNIGFEEIGVMNIQSASSFNGIIYIVIVIFMIIITNTLVSYIQALLASKIKSVSELDSVVMLPTVILVIAYFVSNVIFDLPNIAIYIASSVPVISLFILPTAYMLNKVSLIFVAFSFVVLLTTLVIVYKITTAKFKSNILDLGNKKKIENEEQAVKIKEQEENKLQKSKLSKFVMCVAFALILTIVLGNVVGLLSYMVKNKNLKSVLNILVFAIYIGVPTIILDKMLENGKKDSKKSDSKIGKMYFIGLVGIVIAQVVNVLIVTIFNIPVGKALEQIITVPQDVLGTVFYIVQLAVMPAIFEELLFRKVILSRAKQFGNIFAIIFTAVMFGLFHQNLQQIFGATLVGATLAYVTLKTGNIKTAIAIHFTNNFFSCVNEIMMSRTQFDILKIVCVVVIIAIIIFCIIGIILVVILAIRNRNVLELNEEKRIPIKYTAIFSNYYMILLLVCIISTVVLYLKV